jgi:NAD(P)-dependent dehydrogenase (short-subunit alcohol dehydrogenase family)
VERIARELPGAAGIVGDISSKDDIHRIALQILGRLGGLDVLVNGASSLGPVPLAPLADTGCEDFEIALATNLLGPFRLTRALLGALRASAAEGRGALVLNISSDAAITPYAGWGAYGASKAALDHLTLTLGVENPDIACYAVDPGDMRTGMQQAAFPGEDISDRRAPAEVVPALLDLITTRPRSGRYRVGDVAALLADAPIGDDGSTALTDSSTGR